MLKRTVGRKRWLALCVLVAGVMLVQLPNSDGLETRPGNWLLLGFGMTICWWNQGPFSSTRMLIWGIKTGLLQVGIAIMNSPALE